MRIDKYFYNNPEKFFIEDLKKPIHEKFPVGFGIRPQKNNEASINGCYFAELFPTSHDILSTSYDDFETFLSSLKMKGTNYPIFLKQGSVEGFESYKIDVDKDKCIVTAEDSEGIRRALVYLEGEITRREGAFLPIGTVVRKPYIKDRITRGFFSPTNRPPLYGDELLDNIDYYPDEYLMRLVHSNTNGLWIYTSFRALFSSPFFDDDKEKINKRIEKLKKVVAKCKRYGIKVYIFAIEPMGLNADEASRLEAFLGTKERSHDIFPICLRNEKAKEYILSAVEDIFSEIPDLGGYIDITAGERPTSCPSVSSYRACPKCSKYSRGENLAYVIDIIKEGIRKAGTGAKFISWTYGHRYWEYQDIEEYVKNAPSDVILMQNFEDRGYNVQLEKKRIAFDYWLSYVGPSELYKNTAKYADGSKKELWAKMQVCCSHELATVPYIPVPGILYDKYMKARKIGTTGIMECWYFGNYPSIMSRAAGELSFIDENKTKEEFLFDFAASIYGESKAANIVSSWRLFEEGYLHYPTNIMFSYYGPMHDGVVWKLLLLPKNNPLPRTWQLLDVPDGDRIGECLFAGHTLGEALALCEKMRDNWHKGIDILPLNSDDEHFTVAKAIGLLFSSGYNILKFYQLRSVLGRDESTSPVSVLNEMKNIVLDEIKNSEEMICLCKKDNRLGYHSEAEGFKFFPEKLEDRVTHLKNLLESEFLAVETRINAGKSPISYYFAEGEPHYKFGSGERSIGKGRGFSLDKTEDGVVLKIRSRKGDRIGIYYEFELFSPECGLVIRENEGESVHIESLETYPAGLYFDGNSLSHQSMWGDIKKKELSKHKLFTVRENDTVIHTLYTKVENSKWNRKTAIKLRLKIGGDLLVESKDPVVTLGKEEFSPDEYYFVI